MTLPAVPQPENAPFGSARRQDTPTQHWAHAAAMHERRQSGRFAFSPLWLAAQEGREADVVALLYGTDSGATSRAGAASYSSAPPPPPPPPPPLAIRVDALASPWRCTALFAAAMNGHEGVLRRLLAARASPARRRQDFTGSGPLHAAARGGHTKAVRVLLKARVAADFLQLSDSGTALITAARAGQAGCARALLRAKADVDLADTAGRTPLRCAVHCGDIRMVRLLLDSKAAADQCGRDEWSHQGTCTPLWLAAAMGRAACTAELLRRGASVHRPASHGGPPLAAAVNGEVAVLRMLLAAKARVGARHQGGRTALLEAAMAGRADCVRELLRAKALVGGAAAAANDGSTPLHAAAVSSNVAVLRELVRGFLEEERRRRRRRRRQPDGGVSLQPSVTSVSSQAVPAQQLAATPAEAAAVRALVCQQTHRDGSSPLLVAVCEGQDAAFVAELLACKADADAGRRGGFEAPVHAAACGGLHNILRVLAAEGGADVDATALGDAGAVALAPLHTAALRGQWGTAEVLLELRADPDVATADGETALHLAARARVEDVAVVAELLAGKASADRAAPGRDGGTPLHLAAMLGRHATVLHLVRSRATTDAADARGRTPLMVAAAGGHTAVAVEALLAAGEGGADLARRDDNGCCAADWARAGGHDQLAALLEGMGARSEGDGGGVPAAATTGVPKFAKLADAASGCGGGGGGGGAGGVRADFTAGDVVAAAAGDC